MESLWKDKRFEVYYAEVCGEIWKLLSFFQHTRYHKIDKATTITTKRYVNELVSLRTLGHLIDKTNQVTGHYLSSKYIPGCPELHFWRVCNIGIRSYDRL